MKKLLLTLISILTVSLSFSQSYNDILYDTLNQVDENGKKTGYWIELLSCEFEIVKKEKKASYFRYVYFQNNIRFDTKIVTFVPSFKKFIVKSDNISQKEEIKLLNGYYSIIKPNTDIIIKEFLFKDGFVVNFKEYHENGKIGLDVDYTKKYQDYIYSCYFSMYDENGVIMLDGYHILEDGEMKYIEK